MDNDAIQATAPDERSAAALDETAAPEPRSFRRRGPFWGVLHVLASLRLTVVLMALAMVLVYCGTLAQREFDIWRVVGSYFRTWGHYGFIQIPLRHVVFYDPPGWFPFASFPFPAGYVIGGGLIANLLAAHFVRFKLTWKRAGIVILHAGVGVMLLGEFVTAEYADEASMTIVQGQSADFLQDARTPELAVLAPNDKADEVVAVPGALLKPGSTVHDERLPFAVDVVQVFRNSGAPKPRQPGDDNPATHGDGLFESAVERPEISGTSTDQKYNLPTAYVRFTGRDGADLGTYLLSVYFADEGRPQLVKVGDKTYEVFLRFRRRYTPYTVHLIKFNHEVYPGTTIPKDYSSVIRLVDPANDADRQVKIKMNEPLYYRGETFYQSSFLPGDSGTVLQVVSNPGWALPYVSFTMVAVGMFVHFAITLVSFQKYRRASS